MKRAIAFIGLMAVSLIAVPAAAQMTVEQAREEGKALGTEKKNDSTLVPTDNAQAEAVPGYAGTSIPEGNYFDDPEKLKADAASTRSSNEQYRIATDPEHSRPTFSNSEILATTARGSSVENDPSTYLAGEDIAAGGGSCTPLPPASGAAGYYEASCNAGTKVEESAPSCTVPLAITVEPGPDRYRYVCEDTFDAGRRNASRLCTPFEADIGGGVCRVVSRVRVGQGCLQGRWPRCTEPGDPIFQLTLECDHPVSTRSYTIVNSGSVVSEAKDEAACHAATSGQTCEMTAEVCTDSDPVTRTINGLPVTRPCWAWQRSYQCHRLSSGNDCSDLEANASCSFLRTECLDEDPDGGPCKVEEHVYRCPTPAGETSDAPQYICGDDVYCINGDCEPIVREASTEFKDALVALHAIDQAGKEFNESDFTVFSGERDTCHKPVFGLINCCAGKVSGLVPVAAGAAALAGGPAAIAAFATPFLMLFACSQDEMKLDIKDRMGFCHKVGTYCSSSFLGICKTKRTAYCCFESKLSRVLQEQGRTQLGKPWGSPKKEQCKGFTINEFAQLDLSVMDFTEVYADFMDAVKLPDEVQTMTEIQQKIQDYYDLHGE